MKYLIAMAGVMGIGLMACGGGGQSEACANLIACGAALEDEIEGYTATDNDAAYGEDGTCWETTTEAADACTTTCEGWLDDLIDYAETNGVDPLPESCAVPE